MASPSHFRAQSSIETLLVFLIFLSAFGIVYAASSRLAAVSQSRLDTSISQSSFSDFSAKLQAACALGNGNVRMVEVKGKPAALALAEEEGALSGSGGSSIFFTAGNFSARANSSCGISLAGSSPARVFRIENSNGTLLVSPESQQ
jgi:hypothetical protein